MNSALPGGHYAATIGPAATVARYLFALLLVVTRGSKVRTAGKFLAAGVSVAALLLPIRPVAAGAGLPIDQCYQERTEWCWAAVSQCALRAYGYSRSQAEIAAYGTAGLNEWNWLWGNTANPTRRGIDMILFEFAGLTTTRWSRSLVASYAEGLLQSRRVFVIRWGWASGGGHFVLPRAITGSTWTLMDPWHGPTVNSYAWVVAGGGHTWTHSLSIDTAAPLPPPAPAFINSPPRDNDGWFTISWPTVKDATGYTLQRSPYPSFASSTTLYSGPAATFTEQALPAGTYYYRVRSNSQVGASAWTASRGVAVVCGNHRGFLFDVLQLLLLRE